MKLRDLLTPSREAEAEDLAGSAMGKGFADYVRATYTTEEIRSAGIESMQALSHAWDAAFKAGQNHERECGATR